MSSPSNYPPGVTGNEPQITGESEYEDFPRISDRPQKLEARCRTFLAQSYADLGPSDLVTPQKSYSVEFKDGRLLVMLEFLTELGPERVITISEDQSHPNAPKVARVWYWTPVKGAPGGK